MEESPMHTQKWQHTVNIDEITSRTQTISQVEYNCSAQSENLCNLDIALHILRIPRLRNHSVQSFTPRRMSEATKKWRLCAK